MDAAQEDGPFARLDVALLAVVLRRVPLQQRAANCMRVSSTWREAAWAATTEVYVSLRGDKHSSDFTLWLQAHPNRAAIRTITFTGLSNYSVIPQLPAGHLLGLQSLKASWLGRITVIPSQAQHNSSSSSAVAGAPTGSLLLLTSLTCLYIRTTAANTAGLAALTQLKELKCGELAVTRPVQPGQYLSDYEYEEQLETAAAAVLGQLADALPALQALTSLELPQHEYWIGDAMHTVMQQLSCLTRLQSLKGTVQHGARWLETSVLPQTLTALSFRGCSEHCDSYPDIGPSAPCMRQLTALQELEVHGCTLYTGLLGGLVALKQLNIRFSELASAPGVPQLLVLSRLTALECLQLQDVGCARAGAGWTKEQEAAADSDAMLAAQAAAVTASTCLTSLHVESMLYPVGRHLFSNGQLCPSLRDLSLINETPHRLLQNADATRQMVSCCPGLTSLMLDQWCDDIYDTRPGHLQLAGSISCLTGLHELRFLWLCFNLCGSEPASQHAVFQALGALTAPTGLVLQAPGLEAGSEGDAVELVRCRQLKSLMFEPISVWHTHSGVGTPTQCTILNKAPCGSPSDVWCQLLQRLVLQAAAKAGIAEDSAQQAVTAMLDGVTAPTDAVIDAARAFILQCSRRCDSS